MSLSNSPLAERIRQRTRDYLAENESRRVEGFSPLSRDQITDRVVSDLGLSQIDPADVRRLVSDVMTSDSESPR